MNDPLFPESAPESAAPVDLNVELLPRLKRMFRESHDGSMENDALCVRDGNYFHGDQLTLAQIKVLKRRGQPVIKINMIAPAINGVLGLVDAADADPEAFPRNPSAQNAADIATKTLRYIADRADLARTKRKLSEDYFIYGTCAAITRHKPRPNGNVEVSVDAIAWQDFFFDPAARQHDLSDATYMGIAKWMDVDHVKSMWGDAFAALGYPVQQSSGVFDAKGNESSRELWLSTDRKRVRVVEMYYSDWDQHGDRVWFRVVFCEAGILDHGESIYKDDCGCSMCPIEALSFEVKPNGDRYGAIRNMIDPQDEINARRSKALWQINTRQVRQVSLDAQVTDGRKVSAEAAKPDGFIAYGWETISNNDMAQAQWQVLQQSMADLSRMAPTPAVLGRFEGEQSGRSRQILAQAGQTEWSRSMERLDALEVRLYRQMWARARQFMQAPQWVRVTADGRAPEFLQVNEIVGHQLVPQPVVDPQTGQPAVDPHTGQPAVQMVPQPVMKNRLAEIDVDIILSRVPDTVNLEQEVFAEMLRYAGSTGVSPMSPEMRLIILMSPLPNKAEMLERFDAASKDMGQQVQAQQQAAQQQQELAAKVTEAKVTHDVAKASKAAAQTQQIELENEAMARQLSPMVVPGVTAPHSPFAPPSQ